MKRRAFGLTADGRTVEAVQLSWPGGLEVEVLTFGAIVHRLAFPVADGAPRQAILAYDDLEGYERDTAYIGALVGRVANRLAGGRFPLDGREVQVSTNEDGNTLHGGRVGFNKRAWRVEDGDARSVTLAYSSPDGEEGFPGALEVQVRFALTAADTLEIAYEAVAGEVETVVNLTHHLYVSLGAEHILDHRLTLAADAITPVGPGLIPTGEIAPVEGGPFDLREGAIIGECLAAGGPQIELAGGLDFNWALREGGEPALTLQAPDGAWLEVTTDQPGVQVYSGHKLQAPFERYGALAIEPQGFPDAPNHPAFPSIALAPGETYRRRSRYRLQRG